MVASDFESVAISLLALTFSPSLPLILSAFSRTPSTEPYSLRRAIPFFSPIPGTPGILSDLSPMRPFRSINCFGVNEYRSIIAASSYMSNSVIPFLLITTLVFLSIS